MDTNEIRKELNKLLKNVVNHSESFPENRPIPSLEISAVLSKINKMQENLAVLKFLLEVQEKGLKNSGNPHKNNDFAVHSSSKNEDKFVETVSVAEKTTIVKEPITTTLEEEKRTLTPKKEQQEVAQKLKNTPIRNLKDAFSLNDKYLFANELFNKNMEVFLATVKSIDECSSFGEAIAIFNRLKEQSNWDEENTFYLEFVGLIERRFNL